MLFEKMINIEQDLSRLTKCRKAEFILIRVYRVINNAFIMETTQIH